MLRKLGPARALDPCHRPEGSWALGTRMMHFLLATTARMSRASPLLLLIKFSYVGPGNIPDDRGFYVLPTIPDSADISDIRQRYVPDLPDYIPDYITRAFSSP